MAAPRAIAGYAVNKLSSPFYTSRVKLVRHCAENFGGCEVIRILLNDRGDLYAVL